MILAVIWSLLFSLYPHLWLVPVRASFVLHELHAAIRQQHVVGAGGAVVLTLLIMAEVQTHAAVLHVVGEVVVSRQLRHKKSNKAKAIKKSKGIRMVERLGPVL